MNEFFAFLLQRETPYILTALLLFTLLLNRFFQAPDRVTVRHTLLFLLFWFVIDISAGVFFAFGKPAIADGVHSVALLGFGLVAIRLFGSFVFRIVLPPLSIQSPRIVEDIAVIGGYFLWLMFCLSRTGIELSSLVATSAVVTAVVAFAMQDTLGNILGGLALQLDASFQIGDWIRFDDVSGQVVEIHWRHTVVMTRNGEKVVVPNSQLMKNKFFVIGRQEPGVPGGMPGWRRWIWLNVGYNVPPAQVITVVERAVASADIANVARVPPPSCVTMEFTAGSIRYGLRYWMVDPKDDDATDSAVRLHALAALQRRGWRIAVPEQRTHFVTEDKAHYKEIRKRELERRLNALSDVELFNMLEPAEREKMARRLVYAPFAQGDVITRQGAVAHWLYIIAHGEARVVWEAPDGQRHELTRLPGGNVFGEMGLLTGASRVATLIAVTDVECYRLDKAGFEDIIRARPDLAESMSEALDARARTIEELQERYQKYVVPRNGDRRAAIVSRIRDFFGL